MFALSTRPDLHRIEMTVTDRPNRAMCSMLMNRRLYNI